MGREKGGRKEYLQIYRIHVGLKATRFSSPPWGEGGPFHFFPVHAPFSLLVFAFSLPDKRPTISSSFTGFQPHLLARRDSSLKRLTRWGSQGTRTPSPSSSEQQKSLNGGDEAPISASTPQEDKLDPAPEN